MTKLVQQNYFEQHNMKQTDLIQLKIQNMNTCTKPIIQLGMLKLIQCTLFWKLLTIMAFMYLVKKTSVLNFFIIFSMKRTSWFLIF